MLTASHADYPEIAPDGTVVRYRQLFESHSHDRQSPFSLVDNYTET